MALKVQSTFDIEAVENPYEAIGHRRTFARTRGRRRACLDGHKRSMRSLRSDGSRVLVCHTKRSSILGIGEPSPVTRDVALDVPNHGMHIVAYLRHGRPDVAVERAAATRDVVARAISPLYTVSPPRSSLLLGFTGFAPDTIAPAVARLAASFGDIERLGQNTPRRSGQSSSTLVYSLTSAVTSSPSTCRSTVVCFRFARREPVRRIECRTTSSICIASRLYSIVRASVIRFWMRPVSFASDLSGPFVLFLSNGGASCPPVKAGLC